MTFLGILVIAIITNMTTTSLNREKEAAVKREKELAKLNEYNKQINELQIEKEKEKMRSNLLRAISHDLRTPLTGMIGASSTYLEAKTSWMKKQRSACHGNQRRCKLVVKHGGKPA